MSNQYPEQITNPMIESPFREWREYGGLHRLEGSCCSSCNTNFYPRRSVCAKCHSQEIKTIEYSGKGKIVNITYNNYSIISLMGFREHIGRYMCLVILDEGPILVGELIEVSKETKPVVNDRVKAVLRKQSRSSNTTWKYGYKFILDV